MHQILHYNITISGYVQGVGYRYSAVRVARSMGIKGYVKNLSNGNVYIEAEATKTQLKKFIDWCYIGPRYSKVEMVNWEEYRIKNFTGFDVRP